MTKSNIKQINNDFKNNIVPYEFTYTVEKFNTKIDFNKLWYNDYYQSKEYIYKKLLPGSYEIPYMDDVITEMSKLILLPSDEMENKNV